MFRFTHHASRVTHHASRITHYAIPILLISALLAGCSLLPRGRKPPGPATARPSPAVEQRPAATATIGPATPGAAPPPETPSPQPTPTSTPLPVLANDLNLLLLGSDRRAGSEAAWNTDTLIVVALRPQGGHIAMFSIPRDLWVNIPGHGYGRINVADYLGETLRGPGAGPQLVAETLEANLGIPIDAYARIRFEGLARIIDAVGGITITSDRALDEWFIDESAPGGRAHMVVVEGPQHMDGKLALMYARARHDSNDLERTRRQQQILLALRAAALRPEVLPRLPALISALADTVETDLRPTQALSLAGLALRLKPEAFREGVFDTTMVRDWTTPGGAMVLLPDRARIEQAWAELTAP
ncbi:MAG TPA: LCP family protein [Anaerolineae bacterium]|nr:LCP family protein [Anaerolineae bacterium]HOQ99617.1 LCP family protein [Anaerolineae bacterium]HPL28415.1 LCP family protein [Anaerolineae bacterium]